jgi:hypothetical protein
MSGGGEGQGPWGLPTACANYGHDDYLHAYRPCVVTMPETREPRGWRRFRASESGSLEEDFTLTSQPMLSFRFGRTTRLEGRWTPAQRRDSPLLGCLHGGGYTSRYFDAPGRSLVAQASAAGFPAVALTRPGYPADEDSARRQPSFAEAAHMIDEAIADVWDRLARGDPPGIVLTGHAIGAAMAAHVAAQKPSWPLLGLAISGVGDVASPTMVELLAHMPSDLVVEFSLGQARPLLYAPEWTLNTTALADVADLGVNYRRRTSWKSLTDGATIYRESRQQLTFRCTMCSRSSTASGTYLSNGSTVSPATSPTRHSSTPRYGAARGTTSNTTALATPTSALSQLRRTLRNGDSSARRGDLLMFPLRSVQYRALGARAMPASGAAMTATSASFAHAPAARRKPEPEPES